MLRPTTDEKAEVIANGDHLKKLKISRSLPLVFTEHGEIMAAGILNTPMAVEVSLFVVRAFVKLREMARDSEELSGPGAAAEEASNRFPTSAEGSPAF